MNLSRQAQPDVNDALNNHKHAYRIKWQEGGLGLQNLGLVPAWRGQIVWVWLGKMVWV